MTLPFEFRIDAWDGIRSPLLVCDRLPAWSRPPPVVTRPPIPVGRRLAPELLVDERNWRHPSVGWGLVLPDTDDASASEKAAGEDAPEPLRRLLAARAGSPVLRWNETLSSGQLYRYYPDGGGHALSFATPRYGTAHGCIPRYLLIYASPTRIPWLVQYELNASTYVGRLDIEGEALENYVEALLGDWSDGASDPNRAVLWSVDHGAPDITWLMDRTIGRQLRQALDADGDIGCTWLGEADAVRGRLGQALGEFSPALICTTSHGMTSRGDSPDAPWQHLGTPVDADRAPLTLSNLGGWSPGGAIWFAQACCSAGSDTRTQYRGLISPDDPIGRMIGELTAGAGGRVAPLPRALLGMKRPLKAFIGHVEPTFDWTLRDPLTRQPVTHTIIECLYRRLYQQDGPQPIGWALEPVYREATALYAAHRAAMLARGEAGANDAASLYQQLASADRQSLVILGDPTVALDPLRPA